MAEYNIKYNIVNQYEEMVKRASFQLRVLPFTQKGTTVSEVALTCSENVHAVLSSSNFGFQVYQLNIEKPFREISFHFNAIVNILEKNPFDFLSLSLNDEFPLLQEASFKIDNHWFLRQTDLTEIKSDHLFIKYDDKISLVDYLTTLKSQIHNLITYEDGITNVESTATDVLQEMKGVCQDFTHLFIGICRLYGIPARYVSGYLDQGKTFVGSSQLHAWCEVFIPHVGWIGIDPTNNLFTDHHYIKIAHGVDYKDCVTLKGVFQSTGAHQSIHEVLINNQ